MDDYLIDRQTLSQFVDNLIKKKTLPVNNPEELDALREKTMKSLDDEISLAIFGNFTEEQNTEFNQMLDRDASEAEYENFFQRINLNIGNIVAHTLKTFAQDFLGGQNA